MYGCKIAVSSSNRKITGFCEEPNVGTEDGGVQGDREREKRRGKIEIKIQNTPYYHPSLRRSMENKFV